MDGLMNMIRSGCHPQREGTFRRSPSTGYSSVPGSLRAEKNFSVNGSDLVPEKRTEIRNYPKVS